MSTPLYKRQPPPTKQAHTSDTSSVNDGRTLRGRSAMCQERADRLTSERGRVPKRPYSPDALRSPDTPHPCPGQELLARTARGSAPLLFLTVTSRCFAGPGLVPRYPPTRLHDNDGGDEHFGDVALYVRYPPARFRDDDGNGDGNDRNAAGVEFWAVLQKNRPDFDMVLEFCAVFRQLARCAMRPTGANAEPRRPFGQIQPAKPPRRSRTHEPARNPLAAHFPTTPAHVPRPGLAL